MSWSSGIRHQIKPLDCQRLPTDHFGVICQDPELLWGELWVKSLEGISWRHPLAWRRHDILQRLLSAGVGHLPEATDLEYLNVKPSHASRLHAAEDDAIFWGAICCLRSGFWNLPFFLQRLLVGDVSQQFLVLEFCYSTISIFRQSVHSISYCKICTNI